MMQDAKGTEWVLSIAVISALWLDQDLHSIGFLISFVVLSMDVSLHHVKSHGANL
jgi:hypothetical protein